MSRLMAAFYDRGLRTTEAACLSDWRGEILRHLSGRVLEVGAGTGLNLPHYPSAVTRIVLTEPDPHMRARLLGKVGRDTRVGRRHAPGPVDGTGPRGDSVRRASKPVPPDIAVAGATLGALPMEAASFDAVVGTLTLCSVPDLNAALGEIARVLRPGGRFAFLEHVAAEKRPRRLRWQRRIEPVWKRLTGNCHLTRRTEDALRSAGFEIEWIRRESMRKAFAIVRPTIRGLARKPGAPRPTGEERDA